MSTVLKVLEGGTAWKTRFLSPLLSQKRDDGTGCLFQGREYYFTPVSPTLVSTGLELLGKMTFMQKENLNEQECTFILVFRESLPVTLKSLEEAARSLNAGV